MLPLGHAKSALRVSGSLPAVHHPVAPGKLSFSARVTRCPSCTALGGRLSLSDTAVGKGSHFYAVSGTERSLGQRDAFLSAGDSQDPRSMAGRLRVGSGCPGSPLRLTPWLHSQRRENSDLVKGLASIQTGGRPQNGL